MFYPFSCDLHVIITNARIFIIFYVTIFGKPTTSFINKVGFWIVPYLELCNCYDELILRWVFLWVRYLPVVVSSEFQYWCIFFTERFWCPWTSWVQQTNHATDRRRYPEASRYWRSCQHVLLTGPKTFQIC